MVYDTVGYAAYTTIQTRGTKKKMGKDTTLHGTYKITLRRLPQKKWYMRKTQNEIWLFINKIIAKGWGITDISYKTDNEIAYQYKGSEENCDEQRKVLDKTFSKDTYLAPLKKSWNWVKSRFKKDTKQDVASNVNGWDDLQEKVASFGIVIIEEYIEDKQ